VHERGDHRGDDRAGPLPPAARQAAKGRRIGIGIPQPSSSLTLVGCA
jgi:hypothetical protein